MIGLGSKHCFACILRFGALTAVSWGTLMRIRLPSLPGVSPRSEDMMAFSMLGIEDLSYGCTTSKLASGAERLAICLRGVGAP